jgi:hypothetical protein
MVIKGQFFTRKNVSLGKKSDSPPCWRQRFRANLKHDEQIGQTDVISKSEGNVDRTSKVCRFGAQE